MLVYISDLACLRREAINDCFDVLGCRIFIFHMIAVLWLRRVGPGIDCGNGKLNATSPFRDGLKLAQDLRCGELGIFISLYCHIMIESVVYYQFVQREWFRLLFVGIGFDVVTGCETFDLYALSIAFWSLEGR